MNEVTRGSPSPKSGVFKGCLRTCEGTHGSVSHLQLVDLSICLPLYHKKQYIIF